MTIKMLKELVNTLELSEGNQDAEVLVHTSSPDALYDLERLIWEDEAAEWQLVAHPA